MRIGERKGDDGGADGGIVRDGDGDCGERIGSVDMGVRRDQRGNEFGDMHGAAAGDGRGVRGGERGSATQAPTGGLMERGVATAVSGSGPWTWVARDGRRDELGEMHGAAGGDE